MPYSLVGAQALFGSVELKSSVSLSAGSQCALERESISGPRGTLPSYEEQRWNG